MKKSDEIPSQAPARVQTEQEVSIVSYYSLCINVQRINRIISRQLDTILRPLGLTSQQMIVLGVIAQQKIIRLSAIADNIGKDQATVTANLGPLMQRSLVHTAVDETDRRARVAALTGSGEELLRRARETVDQFDAKLILHLGEPDLVRKLFAALAHFGESSTMPSG